MPRMILKSSFVNRIYYANEIISILSREIFIAEFNLIRYKVHGIFTGSRGLAPLQGRSEEGAEGHRC